MNKKERIIIAVFMLWIIIFVGLSRISLMHFIWAVGDLETLLIYFMDINPINFLIYIIIESTITKESEITSLCLNFVWFGTLIFMLVFNLIIHYSKKENEK